MTIKDRENRFIEKFKLRGPLTFEAEMLLRFGFAQGAEELSRVAYYDGAQMQRATVLDALGAVSRKEDSTP